MKTTRATGNPIFPRFERTKTGDGNPFLNNIFGLGPIRNAISGRFRLGYLLPGYETLSSQGFDINLWLMENIPFIPKLSKYSKYYPWLVHCMMLNYFTSGCIHVCIVYWNWLIFGLMINYLGLVWFRQNIIESVRSGGIKFRSGLG